MATNNFSDNILLVAGIPIKGFSRQNPIRWERKGKDWGYLTLNLLQSSPYNTALSALVSGTNYEVIEGCGNRLTMRCSQTGIIPLRFPVLGIMDGRTDILNFSHCAIDGYPLVYEVGLKVQVNGWRIICTGNLTIPTGALVPGSGPKNPGIPTNQ